LIIAEEATAEAPAWINMVSPNGESRIVAGDIGFPNDMIITPDGKTLIAAETYAKRLSAFNIEPDGSLINRKVWAQFEDVLPDGICLDAEGTVWVASPLTSEVIRVREGGEIIRSINTIMPPFACMLGGSDRKTLFILEAETPQYEEARTKKSSRIEIMEVDVAGAGIP